MLEEIRGEDPRGIAVIEAAILIETGRYKSFARLILTACSPEIQIARAMKRDAATREQVLARLEKQIPMEEKKRHAHYMIDTGGTKEATARQVDKMFHELKELAEATV